VLLAVFLCLLLFLGIYLLIGSIALLAMLFTSWAWGLPEARVA